MRALKRDLFYYFLSSAKVMLICFGAAFIIQYLTAGEGIAYGMKPLDAWLQIVLKDNGLIIDYRRYQFPLMWMIHHFVPIMLISGAFWRDHSSNGVYLITQAESRRGYFVAALLSGMLLCLLFQAVQVLVLLLPSMLIDGVDWTMGMASFLRVHSFIAVENMVLLTAWELLALRFGYRAGLVGTLLWLFMATLVPMQGMLGSGSLVMRQDFITPEGFDLTGNLIVVAIYAVVLFGLYLRRAQTYDFFSEVKS